MLMSRITASRGLSHRERPATQSRVPPNASPTSPLPSLPFLPHTHHSHLFPTDRAHAMCARSARNHPIYDNKKRPSGSGRSIKMAGPTGLEPATSGLTGRCAKPNCTTTPPLDSLRKMYQRGGFLSMNIQGSFPSGRFSPRRTWRSASIVSGRNPNVKRHSRGSRRQTGSGSRSATVTRRLAFRLRAR